MPEPVEGPSTSLREKFSMKIFVSGTIAYDVILDYPGRFVDHIDPKKIHALSISFLLNRLERSIGGTAGNIAYNLAMLEAPVKLLGSVGRDGVEILKMYKNMSIDILLSKISKRYHTASAFIITDQMDNQIAGFYPGAMNEKVKLPNSKSTDWGIIAAENPRNMARLARHYTKNKVRTIFDPGQAITSLTKKQMQICLRGASIVIGNDYEVSALSLRSAARRRSNPFIVIRTFGSKGSEIIYPNGKRIKIGIAKPKKVVDPTGAGDAYRAGLVKGIISGLDLKRSAQLGATAAAFAVEKYGTQNHKFNYGILVKWHNQNFRDKI